MELRIVRNSRFRLNSESHKTWVKHARFSKISIKYLEYRSYMALRIVSWDQMNAELGLNSESHRNIGKYAWFFNIFHRIFWIEEQHGIKNCKEFKV